MSNLPPRAPARAPATQPGAQAAPARQRAAAPAPAGAPAAPAANPFLKRGSAAIAGAEQARQQQEQKAEQRRAGVGNVFRFSVRKGETREIIILDTSLEEAVALHEHQYEQNGNWNNYEQCIREATACPICEKLGRESYYANYLTVLDLTGYTRRNSQEHVAQFRCLLRIKGAALDKFKQLTVIARAQGKSLRGMFLRMHRDSSETSSNIGEPMMLEECGGAPFYLYDEDALISQFGHPPIIGRDGKTIVKPANQDIEPFPYDIVFPAPDITDVVRRWGGTNLHAQAADELRDAPEPAATVAPGGPRRQLPAANAPMSAPARLPAAPAPAPAGPARAAGPAPVRPAAQQAPAPAAPARARAAPAPAAGPAPTRAPVRASVAAPADLDDADAGDAAGSYAGDDDDPLG